MRRSSGLEICHCWYARMAYRTDSVWTEFGRAFLALERRFRSIGTHPDRDFRAATTAHGTIMRRMRDVRTTFTAPANRLTVARALAYGTLVVGVLDLTDALVFFGLRGARPIRIGQSIAAGLLGRAAFSGGWPTALLGVALHFVIALCIVTTYGLLSRRLPLLTV